MSGRQKSTHANSGKVEILGINENGDCLVDVRGRPPESGCSWITRPLHGAFTADTEWLSDHRRHTDRYLWRFQRPIQRRDLIPVCHVDRSRVPR
jgi:hypothetical protein